MQMNDTKLVIFNRKLYLGNIRKFKIGPRLLPIANTIIDLLNYVAFRASRHSWPRVTFSGYSMWM